MSLIRFYDDIDQRGISNCGINNGRCMVHKEGDLGGRAHCGTGDKLDLPGPTDKKIMA